MTRFSLEIGFFLGKKLCLKGKIEITELLFALKFGLLKQNKLPKKQKRNLKSGLKEKLMIIKRINKLFCVIKLLLKSKFYSLNDRLQINEILLESAFCLFLIILILLLFLLLPFASDISSACQIWQLLQQLLRFLFGSGPG
jgi:hypothetical protein